MSRLFLAACCLLLVASPAPARQTEFNAGLALHQDYDSNVNRTESNTTEEWTTTVAPSFRLTSRGRRDSVEVAYTPGLKYSQRTDEFSWQHRLSATGEIRPTARLTLRGSESYSKTDDFNTTTDSELNDRRSRRTAWTNTVDLSSTVELAAGTALTVGFRHSLLDNRALTASDYQRHEPYLSMTYQWNVRWSAEIAVRHTIGDFDDATRDLTGHRTDGELRFHLDPHHLLFLHLGHDITDYDQGDDYNTLSGQLGYQGALGPQATIRAAAGWSTTHRLVGPDDNGLSYEIGLDRRLAHGSFHLQGEGGFQGQQFNGNNDGLSRYWSLSARLDHQLGPRLTADADLSFRRDEYQERRPAATEDTRSAGAGLSWQLARYQRLALRYRYQDLDSDQPGEDYTDHRLFLSWSIDRDLWHW